MRSLHACKASLAFTSQQEGEARHSTDRGLHEAFYTDLLSRMQRRNAGSIEKRLLVTFLRQKVRKSHCGTFQRLGLRGE